MQNAFYGGRIFKQIFGMDITNRLVDVPFVDYDF